MKTGDILLVHTNSTMGKIIQKFQMRKDKDAGYYNHSGIIYVGKHRTWVAEASQVKGRKIKAAVVFTPLDEYTRRYECECGWGGVPGGFNVGIDLKCKKCGSLNVVKSKRYELLLLQQKENAWINPGVIEEKMFPLMGIPYDYRNLLFQQIRRLVTGIWVGRGKEKGWKRMVCHEFTQYLWNELWHIFPDYNKGSVSKIYRSPYFVHKKL